MIDIITTILIDIVEWLVPHGLVELRQYLKEKPIRRFYTNFGKTIYLIFPPKDMDNFLPGTHIFDLLGAMEFQDCLGPIGYTFERRRTDKVSEKDLQQGIVSIGGPISNKISRSLLNSRKHNLVYGFGGNDGHAIINIHENKLVYRPSFYQNQKLVEVDYGIITRMKNPYDPTKRHDALIVAGSFGWGTQACLRILCDIGSIKYIMNKIGHKDPYFQAICVTEVDEDGIPLTPELIKESIVKI